MLVILRENVENLGTIGEVVNVSPGYARNFLLPRKLVVQANSKNVAQVEHHKKILEKRKSASVAKSEELAGKVSAHAVSFKRKVGRNEKLFGSVSAHDVFEELLKGGFKLDKSAVQLDEPLKTLGEHQVAVKLAVGVTAQVKVTIEKEE